MFQADLDRVLFIPAGDPWQKIGKQVSPGHHRLEMTRIATAGVEGFEVDAREVHREGLSYTIDTLESFPDDEELFLILGADAALGLPTWRNFGEVLARATVLVVPRPGTDSTAVLDVLPQTVFLDMNVLEISGTEIRRLAASGHPYRFLVTGGVHDYIESNNLYTEAEKDDRVQVQSEMEEPS